MENQLFSFKGRGSALRVCFEGTIVPGLADTMRGLRDAGEMIGGRRLVIDFKNLDVSRKWIMTFLNDVILPQGLYVSLWASANENTLAALGSFGFCVENSGVRPVSTPSVLKIIEPLRSGQVFEHDGDVLMLGNLHPGAEIHATGNIIVLGELLGGVHAGCDGNNEANVIALSYKTNHLRIGSIVGNPVEPGTSCWGKPVRMYIESGLIFAQDLKREKERQQ